MRKVYTSVEQLIGGTPLLELTRLEKALGLQARVLAKLEGFNPAGSAKDRAARWMIDRAEADGRLKPGAVIIEPTSGNTGIGLALVAIARGYRLIIVMPDSFSPERRMLMQAYGAQVVLTPGRLGMQGAIDKAEALARETPGSFIPGQFVNPDNPLAHRESTGPEIWEDTGGQVAAFVAGIGTGGTVTGVGQFLKAQDPGIRIVGVEPATSAVLSGKPAGPHGLQGIGAGFVPEILDRSVLDQVVTVTEEDAYAAGRQLARTEGVLAGISGGAALWAALELARQAEFAGKNLVVLLPDTGERYLSTPLFGGE